MNNYAIKVENLSKKYVLGQNAKADSLRHLVEDAIRNPLSFFTSKKGKNSESNDFWALKDVSFEVQPGEVVGFIGRNGAGKSTLLKLLSRITEPTNGKISLNGRLASLLEVGTGFHPELTGRENIYLNGAILGMSIKEIKRKFDEIVDFSGVEKFLDTPVKRYSSGMYVRLAFSVAAHLEQEILVVDEVLAVGDREFQNKCIGKMEDVATNGGRTVLFVSHDMRAVQKLCTRGIILEKGQVVYDDSVSKAIEEYSSRTIASAKTELSTREDRKGKGEIQIEEVSFLNSDRNQINTAITGRDLTIRFKYKVINNFDTTERCSLTVGIRGRTGVLTQLSTLYSSNKPTFTEGEGYIEFDVPKLPFSESTYHIDFQLKEGPHIVQDEVVAAAYLEVVGGEYFGVDSTEGHHSWNGLFVLTQHSWKQKQSNETINEVCFQNSN